MSAGEGRVKIYRVQINQQSTTFSMSLIPEPKQHQWYVPPPSPTPPHSPLQVCTPHPVDHHHARPPLRPLVHGRRRHRVPAPPLKYALFFCMNLMAPNRYFVLAVAFAEIMLVCGLLATLLADSPAARWLLLIYGVFFFCIIVYLLIRRFITESASAAQQKKSQERMRSTFTLAANYTVIVWLMYVIPPHCMVASSSPAVFL
jgi:hypothetical protein